MSTSGVGPDKPIDWNEYSSSEDQASDAGSEAAVVNPVALSHSLSTQSEQVTHFGRRVIRSLSNPNLTSGSKTPTPPSTPRTAASPRRTLGRSGSTGEIGIKLKLAPPPTYPSPSLSKKMGERLGNRPAHHGTLKRANSVGSLFGTHAREVKDGRKETEEYYQKHPDRRPSTPELVSRLAARPTPVQGAIRRTHSETVTIKVTRKTAPLPLTPQEQREKEAKELHDSGDVRKVFTEAQQFRDVMKKVPLFYKVALTSILAENYAQVEEILCQIPTGCYIERGHVYKLLAISYAKKFDFENALGAMACIPQREEQDIVRSKIACYKAKQGAWGDALKYAGSIIGFTPQAKSLRGAAYHAIAVESARHREFAIADKTVRDHIHEPHDQARTFYDIAFNSVIIKDLTTAMIYKNKLEGIIPRDVFILEALNKARKQIAFGFVRTNQFKQAYAMLKTIIDPKLFEKCLGEAAIIAAMNHFKLEAFLLSTKIEDDEKREQIQLRLTFEFEVTGQFNGGDVDRLFVEVFLEGA